MASLPTLTGFLDAHLPQYGLPGPSTFVFAPGSTPLATWPVVLAGCAGYLSLIFGLQAAMRRFDAKPLQLRSLFVAHNLALVAVSAVLLYETLRIVFSHYLTGGLYYAMCAPAAFGGGIEFWYYLNYLVKWWELADTVFLVLKRKKLEFLHVYHHSMTMVLCFVELRGRVSMQWVVICLNLFVHVIMYYYYARTTLFPNQKIWWKKHLTTLQITQFVIDLAVCYLNTYTHFASSYYPTWPNYGGCAATDFAALFGSGLLSTYLLLFVDFFVRTYLKARQKITRSLSQTALEKKTDGDVKSEKPASVEEKKQESTSGIAVEAPLTPRRSSRRVASGTTPRK